MIIAAYDKKKFLEAIESRRLYLSKELDRVQSLIITSEVEHQKLFPLVRWFSKKPDYSNAISYLTSSLAYILKLRKDLGNSESTVIYVDIDSNIAEVL